MFLETLSMIDGGVNPLGGIGKAVTGFTILLFFIIFGLYVYLSVAYSKIGKKAGITNSGVAWMPVGGSLAVIFESAKAHWWPFLVTVIGFMLGYIIMISTLTLGLFAIVLAGIILVATAIFISVIGIIWHWKTYEAAGSKGWFAVIPSIAMVLGLLLMLVSPGLSSIIYLLGIISHLVFIGIAAWSKQ